jgi:hypothetical protein
MIARCFQISHVAKVQKVETAVGDNQAFAAGTHRIAPFWQVIPRNNLLAKIHASMLLKTAFEAKNKCQSNRNPNPRSVVSDLLITIAAVCPLA